MIGPAEWAACDLNPKVGWEGWEPTSSRPMAVVLLTGCVARARCVQLVASNSGPRRDWLCIFGIPRGAATLCEARASLPRNPGRVLAAESGGDSKLSSTLRRLPRKSWNRQVMDHIPME